MFRPVECPATFTTSSCFTHEQWIKDLPFHFTKYSLTFVRTPSAALLPACMGSSFCFASARLEADGMSDAAAAADCCCDLPSLSSSEIASASCSMPDKALTVDSGICGACSLFAMCMLSGSELASMLKLPALLRLSKPADCDWLPDPD